jgi:hypothetical protein
VPGFSPFAVIRNVIIITIMNPRQFKDSIRHAILDESGNVVPCGLLEWAWWLESNRGHQIIEQTEILGYKVSTIFAGIDMQYMPGRRPLWFETMVFKPPEYNASLDRMYRREAGFAERYSTLKEAIQGHAEGIEWLKAHLSTGRSASFPESGETVT